MQKTSIIILAAGAGTRMKSDLPKILHPVYGKPMIYYLLDTVKTFKLDKKIIIVGCQGKLVKESLKVQSGLTFVTQKKQLGTGHAVIQAKNEFVNYDGNVLILCGDTPLLKKETINNLIKHHSQTKSDVTIITCNLNEPFGYGRIIRNEHNKVVKIIEEKDALPSEQEIKEINTGIYCFKADKLFKSLKNLRPLNNQKELYLTDVIEIFFRKNYLINTIIANDSAEIMGINSRYELAQASEYIRNSILEFWMKNGVTIIHPETTFIDETVKIEKDTIIYPFTIIEGNSIIKSNCKIGPFSIIRNSVLSNCIEVLNSVIIESKIQSNVRIGPYANIRPHTFIEENAKVGNFCEIKKSHIGKNSKVSHLSYIGDSDLGNEVNIGAGTITCNFNGKNKYKTIIEDYAFIGSNSNLVAPVTIGKKALVAAGSTITKNVEEEALGIARAKQLNISNYAKKRRL
ncbi:MAG: bifunctional UDP-N-acetylglucosamine diphosphorylase/glucosamine-1-phosphate N-acetyltransferase GlmU [Candidatus Firestonebacteria bacterium]|nr:bifunctional UDP-N-acetylglucosamine diphosphorylase/glucosamine-1-phosphate N-acetyltransferase GlmU [Candidatus Firestonebacteria bacterium]